MYQPKLYQKYDCYEQESSREYSISNWKEILTFHYQYKLEGSFDLFPRMHIRSVTTYTTRLNDYEPMNSVVSPENWNGSSLNIIMQITAYRMIHWFDT